MNEYKLFCLLFIGGIVLTVVIYSAGYSIVQHVKNKKAVKQRTRYYHHCNRNRLIIEKRDFFGCYLITLGVSHVFLP